MENKQGWHGTDYPKKSIWSNLSVTLVFATQTTRLIVLSRIELELESVSKPQSEETAD